MPRATLMCLRLFWNFVSRLGISPHHSSALTRDIFRPLVIPQAEESRVSQLASRRPLSESDLSDELRFHPMHAASLQPVLGKRGNRRLQPGELLAQTPQQVLVEPCPDLAGVRELLPAVVTQQQCSEPTATPSWVGVTADDELLLLLAFEFEPI